MKRRSFSLSDSLSEPAKYDMYPEVLFHSWGEFVSACESAKPAFPNISNRVYSKHTDSPDWFGTSTFEDAIALAWQGWAEGTEKAFRYSEALRDSLSSLLEQLHVSYSVVGNGLDIGKYTAGHPETWQRYDFEVTEGTGTRHVKIVFNAAVSCGVDADTIIAKGSAIAALVQLLEMTGCQVEVWMGQGWKGSSTGNVKEILVQIKEPGQPLDLPRLVFALAHPSTTRRLAFALLEADKVYIDVDEMGHGFPHDVRMQGDIVLGRAMYGETQWKNPDETRKWIIETLKQQGVTVREQQ
jgi:hypothetical protein